VRGKERGQSSGQLWVNAQRFRLDGSVVARQGSEHIKSRRGRTGVRESRNVFYGQNTTEINDGSWSGVVRGKSVGTVGLTIDHIIGKAEGAISLYQARNRRSIEARATSTAVHERIDLLASTFTNERTTRLPPVLDTFDGQRMRNTARTSYPRLRPLSGQSN